MPLNGFHADENGRKKKKARVGIRRDTQLRVWTTIEMAHALGEKAAERRTSVSSLIHQAMVYWLKNNQETDIDKIAADEEIQERIAGITSMPAKTAVEIVSDLDIIVRSAALCKRKGVPDDIIISDIVQPNIDASKKRKSRTAEWVVKQLEALKKEYEGVKDGA